MAKSSDKPAAKSTAKSAKPVKPIPEGYRTVTPYLIVRGGIAALEFYKKAFGAEETYRMEMGGKLGHAEFKIGDSMLMLADEHPQMGHKSPQSLGGSAVSIVLYVEDCDAFFQHATLAGAKVLRPIADQFYGDRTGTVLDPFGHVWTIATHKEDLSSDDIAKRAAEAMPKG